jgi:hypothetical protein
MSPKMNLMKRACWMISSFIIHYVGLASGGDKGERFGRTPEVAIMAM